MAGKPEGYVEVNVRIQKFYQKYPDGSLRSACTPYMVEAAGNSYVVYGARAYRTWDDPCPAEGWAWEPVPGPTSFTKGSELMNAETSAWGRAIAALGFEVKEGIASANEVRARQGSPSAPAPAETRAPKDGVAPAQAAPSAPSNFKAPGGLGELATPKQRQDIKDLIAQLATATNDPVAKIRVEVRKLAGCSFTDMTAGVATDLQAKLEEWLSNTPAQAELGGGVS